MNKIVYVLVAILTLTSCAESYNIQGSSTVSSLDGNKLYLKAVKDQELKNIDSCDVVHGKFRFTGLLDTIRMASLYMDDESIMPVVVEKGEIEIKIDNANQRVSGTPLNDKLYEFITLHNQLSNEMGELAAQAESDDARRYRRGHHQPAALRGGSPYRTAGGQPGDQFHRGQL